MGLPAVVGDGAEDEDGTGASLQCSVLYPGPPGPVTASHTYVATFAVHCMVHIEAKSDENPCVIKKKQGII